MIPRAPSNWEGAPPEPVHDGSCQDVEECEGCQAYLQAESDWVEKGVNERRGA